MAFIRRRFEATRAGLNSFSALMKRANMPAICTGIIIIIVTAVAIATGCLHCSSSSFGDTTIVGDNVVVDVAVV